MAKVERNTRKRYVYKIVASPVGKLTLVATDQHDDLDPKENAVERSHGNGIEQKHAADDHHRKACSGPRQKPARNLRHRHSSHRQAQKTQVQHDNHSEKQAHGENMDRLDNRIAPEGFVECDTPRGIREPFEEAMKGHSTRWQRYRGNANT